MSVTFWAAVAPPPPPPGIQNGITAYTCTPCSSSRCTNSQKSGRVCSKVLSRKAYYSCQVSRICVAAVSVETRALETDSTIAVDRVEPCTHESAVQPVSPLSRSSHDQPLEVCCRQRRHSGQGFCSFSSKTALGTNYYSRDWLARKNISRNVNTHRCTQPLRVSTATHPMITKQNQNYNNSTTNILPTNFKQ